MSDTRLLSGEQLESFKGRASDVIDSEFDYRDIDKLLGHIAAERAATGVLWERVRKALQGAVDHCDGWRKFQEDPNAVPFLPRIMENEFRQALALLPASGDLAVAEQAAYLSDLREVHEALKRTTAEQLALKDAEIERPKESWRCFHCGFETANSKEAAAHFGDRDDAEEFKPLCRWWQNMTPEERGEALQDAIQQLNDEQEESVRLRAQLSEAQRKLGEARADGAELIRGERDRQIQSEGWTPAHDDEHISAEMTRAAVAYAEYARALVVYKSSTSPYNWPWQWQWWKPSTDPIRNLVKAGALIAAEIDRLQRAALADTEEPKP